LARRYRLLAVTIGLIAGFAVPALGAPPVAADLTTWIPYDQPHTGVTMPLPGSWLVDPGGVSVVQTVNGKPTFFASPNHADGYRITATFTTPLFDDDFFGLALGFSTDPADPATDYLLVDWKQGDQFIDWQDGTGPVSGIPGLAVSRVVGVPTLNELWGHINSPANPSGGVTELARGTTLGAIAWADNTSYEFIVEYTATSLDVWVDSSHELSLAGAFPTGPVALYDFSQPGMSFSNVTFQLLNDPPEVIGGGAADVVVNEGQVGNTGGVFTDPDGDPLTLDCSGPCSGFVDNGDGTWSWSRLLPEGPDGFTVTVTASDGDLEATDQFEVTVHNLAPVIVDTSSVPATETIGSTVVVSADFVDAGVLDTHTASFSWGDGSSSAAVVTESSGAGTASATHQYTQPGFYTIAVTVWDDDGGYDTTTLGEVFVFDPDTFVTGGGWVESPQGAWTADLSHGGKATFGFVAAYDRTGTVRGNVEFQLHKGINFHATSFDYLLINGGIAIFEGSGKVNGEPGYHFMIVATDERLAAASDDLFWITITGPGGTLYDGSVYPAQGLPIIGRGIQIHDKG
jgi:hypothetical protein